MHESFLEEVWQLSLREVKWLLQDHIACQRQSWIPFKVGAGASRPRIAKGWNFSSLSIFCDNTNSHNSTQGGLTIQDFFWAVAHLGQCWAFVQAVPSTWSLFLLSLHPLPLTTTNLLSFCMDLPTLDISYKWNIQDMFLCSWFLSVEMFSRFVHVVCNSISFLFMAE